MKKQSKTSNKTKFLHSRVTAQQQDLVKSRAEKYKIRLSDFIRMAAMNWKPYE